MSRGGGSLLQVEFPFTKTKGSPHKLECMYNVLYNNKLIYLYKIYLREWILVASIEADYMSVV